MEQKNDTKEPVKSMQVKRIDLNKGIFEANGHTYRIEGNLSIERYAEFQILEKELAYGMNVQGMFEKMKSITKLLDKQRWVDAVVMLTDMTRGIAKLEEREPTVMKICALFINRDDEDRSTINQDMITQKINDWKTEGIAMADFFAVASNSVSGLLEIYRSVTRAISPSEETENL